MTSQDYKWEGWVGHDADSAKGNMVWTEFTPKTWEETDVDIKITHSGICGTDLHTLRSGWGPTDYPVVVGHEIVGIAVRVGSQASGDIHVGDIVGTYAWKHRNGDKAHGSYALYHRAVSHFVFKIPDGLKPEFAAPMLCAGATVFAPLMEYQVKKGMKVGVVGIGGLGNFAVLFAKAMGAEVLGLSRSDSKKTDAFALGADDYAATSEKGFAAKHVGTLDLIINTSSSDRVPMFDFLSMLKTHGTLVQIGAPEAPIPIPGFLLAFGHKKAGSLVASPGDIREMLRLAAKEKIESWVEKRPMRDANQAIVDMEDGKARYRYVLVN